MDAVHVMTRLSLSGLRWGKYSSSYQKRLLEGGLDVERFLKTGGVGWSVMTEGKACAVDDALELYVSHMAAAGRKSSLRIAKHGVLFVQLLGPRLKGKLQNTWKSLKNWEEQQPSSFRPPIPLVLLAAMICKSRLWASRQNSGEKTDLWYAFSALLVVGFMGLLRPGELLRLTASDVVLANSLSLASCFAVVRIRRPKNSRQMGVQQYVEIRHPDAVNWLGWLTTRSSKSGAVLWPASAPKFRRMFKAVCDSLGIGNLKLSPASLRAGGATWLVDEGTEINRVRFLGRWAHLRSLEHYIQVARAEQIALTISPDASARLKALLARFSFLLVLPQFFASRIPKEHIVTSEVCEPTSIEDVVRAVRDWGRLAKTV